MTRPTDPLASPPATAAESVAPGVAGDTSVTPTGTAPLEDEGADQRLVLSDLLNRVLDRGLVITGSVTLAVADIDLVQLDLRLVLSAVESALPRRGGDADQR